MGKYFKPELKVFCSADLVEVIGPVQAASMSMEGWRGTKLEQPEKYEYRFAENQNDIRVVQLDTKGEVKYV